MYDAVALGELLIDLTQEGTDAGGYPTLTAHPGGAPGNFLAALQRFGGPDCRTAFLGKVGEDAFGRLLCGTLEQAGIDIRGILRDPTVFTTLAFVTLDGAGDRSFSFARKPGADTMLRADELDRTILSHTRVLHFGSLSLTDEPVRTATRTAVSLAREHGAMITYDPNYRPPLWDNPEEARQQMLWGITQADVVKLSEEEGAFLWQASPEEAAKRMLESGVKLAIVTLGAKGCLIKNRQGGCRIGAPAVQAVDTTGAGDIFGGSAVAKLLELGKAPEELTLWELIEVARFGVTAASLSTLKPGGISSLPSQEEIGKFLNEAV